LHPVVRLFDIELRNELKGASYELGLLPPYFRVLGYAILANVALFSSHPLIVGPGAPHPDHIGDYMGCDLREYGLRRRVTCDLFAEEAIRLAASEGVLVEPSWENAATCALLDFLPDGGSCYLFFREFLLIYKTQEADAETHLDLMHRLLCPTSVTYLPSSLLLRNQHAGGFLSFVLASLLMFFS
jgi:hypothetical protein